MPTNCAGPTSKTTRYAFGDIVNASLDERDALAVVIDVVDPVKSRKVQIKGRVDENHLDHARAWTARLLSLAYEGVPRSSLLAALL